MFLAIQFHIISHHNSNPVVRISLLTSLLKKQIQNVQCSKSEEKRQTYSSFAKLTIKKQ